MSACQEIERQTADRKWPNRGTKASWNCGSLQESSVLTLLSPTLSLSRTLCSFGVRILEPQSSESHRQGGACTSRRVLASRSPFCTAPTKPWRIARLLESAMGFLTQR